MHDAEMARCLAEVSDGRCRDSPRASASVIGMELGDRGALERRLGR
jgi:hypothetical protein